MKPTVTQFTTQYAIFRRDALQRTADYALRGAIYNSLKEATSAKNVMLRELPIGLQPLIEVRVVEENAGYRDQEFGKNPLAWYDV